MKYAQSNVTLLFFPDFTPATDQEKGIWSGFEEDDSAWSPVLPHLSGGNQTTTQRGTEEFRLSSESGGFYQLPVSAEDVCRGSTGRQQGKQRPLSLWPDGRA